MQINFGENLPFPASASIDCITYADQSAHSMVSVNITEYGAQADSRSLKENYHFKHYFTY